MAGDPTHAANITHDDRDERDVATRVSTSLYFDTIDGVVYRKKLEKGHIQYREVLQRERRLAVISNFHHKTLRHCSLEETYRHVAENYWWEDMYFHIREFVMSCQQCQTQQRRTREDRCVTVTKTLVSHGSDMLARLNGQRDVGLFCDVTLRTDGRAFCAHRAVLAAVSEYFQELFTEMDRSSGPLDHVDLTGFSEESFLPLLEFCYTSTLSLTLENLPEVSTMARHLRMWAAVDACRSIMLEQGVAGCLKVESSPEDPVTDPPHILPCNAVLLHRKKKWKSCDQGGQTGTDQAQESFKSAVLMPALGVVPTGKPVRATRQVPSENGLPCSPGRRLKLMDFKSPSRKRKPTRLLRSSPSTSKDRTATPPATQPATTPATPASNRLCQKLFLPVASSQPCSVLKQEQVEQEEVQSPHTQEKYRLLSVLGLQRKSLLPGPEELTGWRQKKRLRKLKVDSYSLTTRRKPRAAPEASRQLRPGSHFLPVTIKAEPTEPVSLDDMRLVAVAGERVLQKPLRRSLRGKTSHASASPWPAAVQTQSLQIKREPAACPIPLTGNRRSLRLAQQGVPDKLRDTQPRSATCRLNAAAACPSVSNRSRVKQEPAEPVPVLPVLPVLGKRQSRPSIRLLDPGFLFTLCRPVVKKEETDSIAICVTRSLTRNAADVSGRTRSAARQATKARPKGTRNGTINGLRSTGKDRPKSRRSALLHSVRRARLLQSRGNAPVTSHTCFQCRATYGSCDALIMHRIRHVEGKRWPCPLCSKTFFRQRNVQSHIRTHDHRLYKCHRCLAHS